MDFVGSDTKIVTTQCKEVTSTKISSNIQIQIERYKRVWGEKSAKARRWEQEKEVRNQRRGREALRRFNPSMPFPCTGLLLYNR